MPNVYIREWDNTASLASEYENFSVVVPGFIGKEIYTAHQAIYPYLYEDATDGCVYRYTSADERVRVFDENGVAEYDGLTDGQSLFIKQLGSYEMASSSELIYATVEKYGTATYPITADEYYYTYRGQVYEIEGDPATADSGYLVAPESDNVSTLRKWKLVTSFSATNTYAVILTGKEGHDKNANTVRQIGNQIAYELLGMGYKVLFKKIATGDDTTTGVDIKNLKTITTEDFWECFKDRSLYDFRSIHTGLLTAGVVNTTVGTEPVQYNGYDAFNRISEIAKYVNGSIKETPSSDNGRGDCTALADALITFENNDTRTQSGIINKIKTYVNDTTILASTIDKFSSIFANKPTYGFTYATDLKYSNKEFPASFHYLACARNSYENNYAEWFANAGFDRGVAGDRYEVVSTEFMLGEAAQNALSPRNISSDLNRAVNLIIKIRGNYYLYGNRTARELPSEGEDLLASHFLNIRQLCNTLNKQLYITCKKFTFDPNSDVLWINFKSNITPTLEKMKANQGIKDYKIIKVKSQKKAELRAKIRIVPIEAVEDFYIDMYLENSLDGAVIGEE